MYRVYKYLKLLTFITIVTLTLACSSAKNSEPSAPTIGAGIPIAEAPTISESSPSLPDSPSPSTPPTDTTVFNCPDLVHFAAGASTAVAHLSWNVDPVGLTKVTIVQDETGIMADYRGSATHEMRFTRAGRFTATLHVIRNRRLAESNSCTMRVARAETETEAPAPDPVPVPSTEIAPEPSLNLVADRATSEDGDKTGLIRIRISASHASELFLFTEGEVFGDKKVNQTDFTSLERQMMLPLIAKKVVSTASGYSFGISPDINSELNDFFGVRSGRELTKTKLFKDPDDEILMFACDGYMIMNTDGTTSYPCRIWSGSTPQLSDDGQLTSTLYVKAEHFDPKLALVSCDASGVCQRKTIHCASGLSCHIPAVDTSEVEGLRSRDIFGSSGVRGLSVSVLHAKKVSVRGCQGEGATLSTRENYRTPGQWEINAVDCPYNSPNPFLDFYITDYLDKLHYTRISTTLSDTNLRLTCSEDCIGRDGDGLKIHLKWAIEDSTEPFPYKALYIYPVDLGCDRNPGQPIIVERAEILRRLNRGEAASGIVTFRNAGPRCHRFHLYGKRMDDSFASFSEYTWNDWSSFRITHVGADSLDCTYQIDAHNIERYLDSCGEFSASDITESDYSETVHTFYEYEARDCLITAVGKSGERHEVPYELGYCPSVRTLSGHM